MLEALGLGEGALARLVRSAYHLLGLRTFLTTGDKESRAWTFRAGAKAPEAAGVIHTDLERGFIRAEVIRWDELLEIGSWSKAQRAGQAARRGQGLRGAGRRRARDPLQRVAARSMRRVAPRSASHPHSSSVFPEQYQQGGNMVDGGGRFTNRSDWTVCRRARRAVGQQAAPTRRGPSGGA